jgi:large subunit ribosomal protein L6
MSRIGSLKLDISKLKEFKIENKTILASNGKNSFSMVIPGFLKEHIDGKEISFEFLEDYFNSNRLRRINYPMWGTFVSTLRTKIKGLVEGFSKKLIIFGTGYRVDIKDKTLVFKLGFSHPKEMAIPEYIEASVQSVQGSIELTLKCYDKCMLGDYSHILCLLRAPNGYSEKGIRDSEKPLHIKEVKKK